MVAPPLEFLKVGGRKYLVGLAEIYDELHVGAVQDDFVGTVDRDVLVPEKLDEAVEGWSGDVGSALDLREGLRFSHWGIIALGSGQEAAENWGLTGKADGIQSYKTTMIQRYRDTK